MYRRNYSNWHNRNAALAHVSAYRQLEQRLGPIVEDVKNAFFDLEGQAKRKLLDKYGQQYGVKAREYAEETFYSWKTGTRKMSGQTAERLLNLVPEFIPIAKRHDMVKKLCVRNQSIKNQSIEIDLLDPNPGVNSFYTSVEQYKKVELLKHLPGHVMDTLKWLNNDDVTALRAILAEMDKRNAEEVAAVSLKEFQYIKSVVERNKSCNGNFEVCFPTGKLTIRFKQPTFLRKIFSFFS